MATIIIPYLISTSSYKSYYRDPKSLNSHVYQPWTKVVSEPISYSQIFCKCSWYFGLFRFIIRPPWDVSANIYKQTSTSLYRKLSFPFMIFMAMWCGFFFATLAFVQIWMVGPFKKILQLNGIVLRKITLGCYGEILTSIIHILRMNFSGNPLDISTINTELAGVFLRKSHSPIPIDGDFKSGRIKIKNKEKFPKIKFLKLPFMSRLSKIVNRQMIFMKQALEMAVSKLPSWEILESAFRIAAVKRDQNIQTDTVLRRALRLAKSRRGTQEEGHHDAYDDVDVESQDDPLEDRQPSSLWSLAKRLATARARRGKTNWRRARTRIISRRQRKQSFWLRAKGIVYGQAQAEPDRKILKIL